MNDSKKDAIKGILIALAFYALDYIALLLVPTLSDYADGSIWAIPITIFGSLFIILGFILATSILIFSIYQLATGRGDVMARIKKMFESE